MCSLQALWAHVPVQSFPGGDLREHAGVDVGTASTKGLGQSCPRAAPGGSPLTAGGCTHHKHHGTGPRPEGKALVTLTAPCGEPGFSLGVGHRDKEFRAVHGGN